MTRIAAGLLIGALTITGCSVDIERNADGSVQVATIVSQQTIEEELTMAIGDPRIGDVAIDVQDGFILVSATRNESSGSGAHTLTGRVELSVDGGHLAATVSDAEIDGFAIPDAIVESWNRRIATRLERAGNRNPNSTLVSVVVGDEQVAMEWHVDTPASRG